MAPAYRLPSRSAFDEYLVGYKERSAVLRHKLDVNAGGGMLAPVLVIDGHVVGTWRRVLAKNEVLVTLSPFSALREVDSVALAAAAARYGEFVGRRVQIAPAR